MPRKSPRSKKKDAESPRTPAAPRVRKAPGQGRAKATASRAGHASQGARATARPAKKKATGKPKRLRPVERTAPKKRFVTPDPVRVRAILEQLDELYPDARCELDFRSPLQLLIATILSAQCTDDRVNKTTPALFARYPDAASFAKADAKQLEEMIHSTGFFRMKAKAILQACGDIVSKHGGEVPRTLDELVALRGVGRKTANVVLGNAYGVPGLVVDTHVTRLSNRLALTNEQDAVKIEFALQPIVPRESWTVFSHWLILHGRRVCNARKPRCSQCPLSPHCPKVGVTVSE